MNAQVNPPTLPSYSPVQAGQRLGPPLPHLGCGALPSKPNSAFHTALSHGSETAAWPLHLEPSAAAASGLSSCHGLRLPAIPLQCFDPPLQLPVAFAITGLCTQLFRTVPRLPPGPFKSLERSAAAAFSALCAQLFLMVLTLPPGPLKSLGPSAAASSRLSSSEGLRLRLAPPMR